MKLTPRIVAYIGTEEGLVREAYRDSKSIWTWALGIAESGGHNVQQYKDKPQPLDVCLRASVAMLEQQYLPKLIKAFTRDLAENQIAAALSFVWRNGTLRAEWVRDWNAGMRDLARIGWMQWTDHGQQVDRATRERDLFFDAKWPHSLTVPVYSVAKPSYKPVKAVLTDVLPMLQQIMGGS